jgi:hypothetical protein
MNASKDLESMRQFFGAYFNQDWALEFGTTDNALSAYIRDRGPGAESELKELARSILGFAGKYQGEEALTEALYKELECEYYPPADGLSTRRWLEEVAARLEKA